MMACNEPSPSRRHSMPAGVPLLPPPQHHPRRVSFSLIFLQTYAAGSPTPAKGRRLRRPSYNIDSVTDCLPPDPACYVPEPLERANSSDTGPLEWTVAYEQDPDSPQVGAPSWAQVRHQFDCARNRVDFDDVHPHTIRQRQAFISLWTRHVIADRLCV